MDIQELIEFLSLDAKPHIRSTALEYLKGVTGSSEGKDELFGKNPELIKAIIKAVDDKKYAVVSRDAYIILVNLSSDESLASIMVDEGIVAKAVHNIIDEKEEYPDVACMLLSNLTRSAAIAQVLMDTKIVVDDSEPRSAILQLIDMFCRPPTQPKEGEKNYKTYDLLANVFFNVTQTSAGREMIMLKAGVGCALQRLLPFTQYEGSTQRRGGVVGALRNCCFDHTEHKWLLGEEVDLLPHLLLPLAGPEELDDDDMDGMPDDLQYLPPDKTREPDADVRKMLLEALLQLCATKFGREFIKSRKTYPILREYHLWETEEDVREACEHIVDILIADDIPEHVDNFKDVDPKEMFKQVDPTKLSPSEVAEEQKPTEDQNASTEEKKPPTKAEESSTEQKISTDEPNISTEQQFTHREDIQ